MTKYRFIGARRVILGNVENDFNFTEFWFWSTHYVNWNNECHDHIVDQMDCIINQRPDGFIFTFEGATGCRT